jgi:putative pyoverdin transport system ATP-binding/permease protein
MKFIRFLLEVSWRNIVIAATAGFVSGCGNALLISLINRSVNQAAFPNALMYFVILAIFILITSTLSQFMLIRLSQSAIYQLRVKLSESILASPLTHLEKLGEHRLIASMTDDVRSLAHAVSAIPNICIDFATVLGCLVYLAWLSGIIFALTIGFTSFAIWFVQGRISKARKLFSSAREEEDTLLKHFKAINTGIKELKLNRSRRNDFMAKNLKGSAKTLRQKNTKAMRSFAIANGFGQSSQFISMGFILFILPGLMNIPLSLLSMYVLTSTFIAMPMQNLLNRLPEMMRGNIALEKIERMRLSLSNQSEDEIMAEATPEITNEPCLIELDQVTYLYEPAEDVEEFRPPHPEERGERRGERDRQPPPHPPMDQNGRPVHPPHENGRDGRHPHPPLGEDGRPMHPPGNGRDGRPPMHPPDERGGRSMYPPGAWGGRAASQIPQGSSVQNEERGFLLGPISLALRPGEITYIVGGNGSGKSTLAKLITGLYFPLDGSVRLNGVAITPQNSEWYRQHFSAIFTDFHLFESYLGFSQSNLDSEVEDYLRQLQLDHKVQVSNGVLSTTQLSQGQRKRLALLTAYLEDRPVYLFDEWASDQEPLFRDLFYKQILVKLKERGKTVIVITHDDRYFHLADHLVKLDYGKVEPIAVGSR